MKDTPLTSAFRDWMRAVYENTGRCPSEVYVDIRTHSKLFLEVTDQVRVVGRALGGLEIDGVRIRAIDTE